MTRSRKRSRSTSSKSARLRAADGQRRTETPQLLLHVLGAQPDRRHFLAQY